MNKVGTMLLLSYLDHILVKWKRKYMSKFDAIPFYWLDTIKTVKQDKNNKKCDI